MHPCAYSPENYKCREGIIAIFIQVVDKEVVMRGWDIQELCACALGFFSINGLKFNVSRWAGGKTKGNIFPDNYSQSDTICLRTWEMFVKGGCQWCTLHDPFRKYIS